MSAFTPAEVAYLGSSSEATVILAEDCFPGHVDAVRAASPGLRHVVTIGQPRAGELSYEDLVRTHLGAPTAPATSVPANVIERAPSPGPNTGAPKAPFCAATNMSSIPTKATPRTTPATRHARAAPVARYRSIPAASRIDSGAKHGRI